MVEPWFTVTAVDGLMAPPAPDEGVIVQVCSLAEQLLTVVPPFDPMHPHDQGPLPLTVVAVPELHRPVVGAVVKIPLFDDPHTPFTALVPDAVVKDSAVGISAHPILFLAQGRK
jgi:hypothetical protein